MKSMSMIQRVGVAVGVSVLFCVSVGLLLGPQGSGVEAWKLLPPFLAIVLVVATQQLYVSLGSAVVVGALLIEIEVAMTQDAWLMVVPKTFGRTLWEYGVKNVTDYYHLAVLAFTSLLIGLVGIASATGGVVGIVDTLSRFARSVRSTCVTGAVMGLAVFFDDYANTAIIGPTARPLFDRHKIPREKLAYIVDSTAAPVAGLALISSWIGAEAGYMNDVAEAVGLSRNGYALFLDGLPYRFYCFFALILVFIIAWTGWDFGPMRRAKFDPKVVEDTPEAELNHNVPSRPWSAVVPILTVVFGILATVFVWGAPQGPVYSADAWRAAFESVGDKADGNGLPYIFVAASLVGVVVAALMGVLGGTPIKRIAHSFGKGVHGVGGALVVLILAWALSAVCSDLGTALYAVNALGDGVGPHWIPLVVFGLAAVVAFSTGTSWGTMGILIPVAGQIAFEAGGEMVMIISMAAVLDGAILGDHCSPISDTTVLSSMTTGCDHLQHVRTQIPYALLGGAVAAVIGYVCVGAFGMPHLLGWPLGIGVLIGATYGLSKFSERHGPLFGKVRG